MEPAERKSISFNQITVNSPCFAIPVVASLVRWTTVEKMQKKRVESL